MFPVQLNHDAMIFESLSSFGPDKLLEELLAEYTTSPTSNERNVVVDQGAKKTRRRKSPDDDQEINKGEGSSTKEMKKIMHRDVERQRRQEMASLFTSLRSLLPLEFVKGKRSTLDHMDEAVKYIKHMQKRLQGMRNQRDKLKNLSSVLNTITEENVAIVNDPTSFVEINFIRDEIEILISSELVCEAFPLSRVLKELLGRGLNVITCVSTRVKERSIHKIQVEANDPSRIDLLELQNNLANLIRLAKFGTVEADEVQEKH